MAQYSGKYAQVLLGSCNMLEFESWELEYGSNIHETNARSSGVGTGTVDGVESGSGTITGFVDTSDPIWGQLTTGSLYTVQLQHTTSPSSYWTGSARIGKWGTGASRGGDPQKVTIPFTCHGVWTPPS